MKILFVLFIVGFIVKLAKIANDEVRKGQMKKEI